jgi:hypothetical protein
MLTLLPELVLLESDQHLESYIFQYPNINLSLRDTGLWHKWHDSSTSACLTPPATYTFKS